MQSATIYASKNTMLAVIVLMQKTVLCSAFSISSMLAK